MKFSTVLLLLASVAALMVGTDAACGGADELACAAVVNGDGKCPVQIGGLFPIRDTPWGMHLEATYEASIQDYNAILVTAGSTLVLEKKPYSTSTATANSDPGTAVLAIFDVRDTVIGFVGACYSSTAAPAQQVAKIFDIPNVSPSATSPTLSDKLNYPTFYRTPPADAFQGVAMVQIMKFFKWEKYSIISCNGVYCVKGSEAVQETSAANNQTVAFTNTYPRNTQDVVAIDKLLDGILATGIKIIIMFSLGGEVAVILPRMEAKGMKEGGFVVILADAGVSRTYVDEAGDWTGLMAVAPKAGSGTAYDAFIVKFISTYNQAAWLDIDRFTPTGGYVKADANDLTPPDYTGFGENSLDSYGGYAYDATTTYGVAVRALEVAGTTPCNTDMLAYRAALNVQLKITKFDGMTGEVFFDENQDRIGGYDIQNLDGTGSGKWNNIGLWTTSDGVIFNDGGAATPVWLKPTAAGAANAPVNPPETVTCFSGFFKTEDVNGKDVCVECPANTYSVGKDNAKCTSCPSGGVCIGGKTVNADKNYWQGGAAMLSIEAADELQAGDSSLVLPEFYRCNDDSCCLDGGCVEDPTGNTKEIVCLGCTYTAATRCHTNREGLLCADCVTDTNEWGTSCVECTDPAGEWMLFVMFVIFLLVYVLTREFGGDVDHVEGERIMVDDGALQPEQDEEQAPEKGGLIRRLSRKMAAKFKTYYSVFGVLLRMTIEYVQLLGLIVRVSFLKDVLPWFYLSLNFVIASVSNDDPQCIFEISPEQRALLGFLLIFLVYLQLFFCAGVSFAIQKYAQGKEAPVTTRYRTGFWRLSFFCFPIFLAYELNMLACVDIDGTSVLVLTPAVRCWESAHVVAVVLLGLFCIIVVGGLPAWLIHSLNPKRNPEVNHPRLFGMLCAPFKPATAHWYGVWAFIRRTIAFAARVAFIENIKLQKSVIGLVVIGYLLLQVVLRPYRRALINYIQCTFFSCVIVCTMLQMGDTNQNRFDDSTSNPYSTFKDVMITIFVFAPLVIVPFLMKLEARSLMAKAAQPAGVAANKLDGISEGPEDDGEEVKAAAVPVYYFSFANEDPASVAQ